MIALMKVIPFRKDTGAFIMNLQTASSCFSKSALLTPPVLPSASFHGKVCAKPVGVQILSTKSFTSSAFHEVVAIF